MKISTILDQVDLGAMALPEFQRGYVWNREQVRRLMHSLYHRHPIGSLLVWVTKTEDAKSRGDGNSPGGTVDLILDGQQRITTLYGIVRGRPPAFFEGNALTFTGLRFNLETEVFEFYSVKMKDDPLWIDVTSLMQRGVAPTITMLMAKPQFAAKLETYINRLTALHTIPEIELHIEKVTGQDKKVDVVVEIFNNVNSGGTKLSKGDLALARICAAWPEARDEMKVRLEKWRAAGFTFRMELLLRTINAIVTGQALFSALDGVEVSRVQEGLDQAERSIDYLLNLISARLGLDHEQVLASPYSLALMAQYVTQRGGLLAEYRERDKLLYWYVHSFLWGRYSGATESMLRQDLNLTEEGSGALDRLIMQLEHDRGDLRIRPEDFRDWSRGSRFYPMLYMLTRVWHAQDLRTGIELSSYLLGRLAGLQLHHIFPRAVLYKHGCGRPQVNAIANFIFLTQETNLYISDRLPEDYLAEFAAAQPRALSSQWLPNDPTLWRVENYEQFLTARRELLAQAANEFLDHLLGGTVPEVEVSVPVLERGAIRGGPSDEAEERLLKETNDWVVEQGLPEGQYLLELPEAATGRPLARLDLAWPDGLQEGYSQPVALLLNEQEDVEEIARQGQFRIFTDVQAFREYVSREVLEGVPA